MPGQAVVGMRNRGCAEGLFSAHHGFAHSGSCRAQALWGGPPRSVDPPVSRAECRSLFLAAQTQTRNQGPIALGADAPKIIEHPASLTHHLEQPAPGMVVLLMNLEMPGQLLDAFGQERGLHFRRAGVTLVGPVLTQDFQFSLGDQSFVFLAD